MALKMADAPGKIDPEELTKARALIERAENLSAGVPSKPGIMFLELAIYKRYSRKGTVYTNEYYYEFTEEQAAILLRETEPETDRPIWRRYKPGRKAQVIQRIQTGEKEAFDATRDKVTELSAPDDDDDRDPDRNTETTKRRRFEEAIEIGNDEEISDILKPQGEGVSI